MANPIYHFPKKTVKDIDVRGKRILLRADFNVPMQNGKITSTFRITQTLATIKYLLERNCKVLIISHLGRPEGKVVPKDSLEPVAQALAELLPDVPVEFVPDCIGDAAKQHCKKMPPKSVVLLENLRFHPGEEADDPAFARSLKDTSQADYFVQDAFGAAHRAHASTDAICHLLPAVAGLLLEREVSTLEQVMSDPRHPLIAIIGGAKISDKLALIERLLSLADHILIGGAMANTFLKYKGYAIGKSIYEAGQEKIIAKVMAQAKEGQVVLPVDVAVATEIDAAAQRRDCALDDVQPDEYILDLGFETMRLFNEKLKHAATVIWNGTLGYAELPQFAQSSAILAQSLSEQHESLTSIIGGGDTADFVLDWQASHPDSHFSHISTGGGASLELMSGKELPGVEALLDT